MRFHLIALLLLAADTHPSTPPMVEKRNLWGVTLKGEWSKGSEFLLCARSGDQEILCVDAAAMLEARDQAKEVERLNEQREENLRREWGCPEPFLDCHPGSISL